MKAITDRRSIRKYKNIPLEEEKIKDILRAALLAPSAKNRQPWKFIVYQGDAKERLVKAMEKGMEREKRVSQICRDLPMACRMQLIRWRS